MKINRKVTALKEAVGWNLSVSGNCLKNKMMHDSWGSSHRREIDAKLERV